MKYILLLLLLSLLVTVVTCCSPKKFGSVPKGERKARILASPNYRNGQFQNLNPVPMLTVSDSSSTGKKKKGGGLLRMAWRWVFAKEAAGVRPDTAMPTVKTDLHKLNPAEDLLVWFGHSSTFLQVDGKRILIDPVFSKAASPVFFANRAFKGTSIYSAKDMPNIDYLIISHDHWDHLDYPTVKKLKSKVSKIICPLGVGEHFERWGFDMSRVVEMDWNDSAQLDSVAEITCLPARHFSGRGLKNRNQSLWASFLVKTPNMKIYLSGDGGYDTHFAEVGARFGGVDLAILEDGQYNENWKYIHMMPEQVAQAGRDLQAKMVLPTHNSKYALAHHAWREPLNRVSAAHSGSSTLLTPMIGELVSLRDSASTTKDWWKK
ncbi:MAG: MBL fold metallo-hydrolase [Prevotellaceae bacterium]|jgi:L-ascorbate metabolism protein UlaG (beta-lactamase superfamily)|nr:MBL fold metallo-hydrolase [Prevotellaceae bacterium]